MNISHDQERSRFVTSTDHGEAVIEYRRDDQAVDFTHTYVPPPARGRGIAEALVRTALDWAEREKLHVQASCWYVARYIETRRPSLRERPVS